MALSHGEHDVALPHAGLLAYFQPRTMHAQTANMHLRHTKVSTAREAHRSSITMKLRMSRENQSTVSGVSVTVPSLNGKD
jgi:hypothetical protein